MRAAYYEAFQEPLTLQSVADPSPDGDGVVIEVKATGLCRSDWHGWMGHDPDISLPHVPGHELAGVVRAVGDQVKNWREGDRVTLPFVCGCGYCGQCASGNHQVCDNQFQPGFTHWGSFAQYVAIKYADINLVQLPDEIDFISAASLGCRFITSFRAVVAQGRLQAGEWLAVHGCGGVGLSAIMIGSSLGANVAAVDIDDAKLTLAASVGATATVNAREVADVVEAIRDLTGGGAHVSVDALGHPQTCFNSVANLRKRGRHVQVGLMLADHCHPPVPMDRIIAHELEVLGSHGMQAHKFEEIFRLIGSGRLQPATLVSRTLSLEESLIELPAMNSFEYEGVTVIDRF